MWGSRKRRDDSAVMCIACGESVRRDEAREYDKHGDRWDRTDKAFEHICKACFRDLCHQPRDGLESLLVDCEAGERDRDSFLSRYHRLVEQRQDSAD